MRTRLPTVIAGAFLLLLGPDPGLGQQAKQDRLGAAAVPAPLDQPRPLVMPPKRPAIRVAYPLKLRMRGRKVADLQEALLTFLKRGLILADDEATRKHLTKGLTSERKKQYFGRYTRRAVSSFQRARGLRPTGEVDRATAEAMNALL